MIGSAYQSKVVQAMLGPSRSLLFPATLWVGWLDADGTLIAMSGTSVAATAWGPVDTGVTNTALIDAGVADDGWAPIAAVGLFDAADGALVVSIPLDATPVAGQVMTFAPGALTVTGA